MQQPLRLFFFFFLAHLFVFLNQGINCTQPEDQQASKKFNVSFAFVGFLSVVEVDVDLIDVRLWWRFGVADEFHRLRFHHGAAIKLASFFLPFGGCHRRPVSSRRNQHFLDIGRVRPRQSRNYFCVGHVYFSLMG